MSNHNIFKSPIANDHIPHSKRGFTLVEMLIIAPIVILVIGIFVSAIISMTGDVLSVRGKNALVYNIQDTLNRIDQDVKSSSGYLATNNIALTSPQGYDDNTSTFKNADASNGTMLILNTYATTANPLSSTRNFVYTTSPNACNSALVSQNQKVAMNIVYFVKNNALWRRVIAPSSYATVGCSVPWQQPTCAPGYVASFCKTQDMKLVDGVSANGFVLNYYTSAAATTPIANAVNNTLSDANRQTALQTASSINVTITATKTLAGRDVSQSGTIRSSSPNTGTTSNSLVLSNSGGGTWAYKRPITITNSSGGALTNYQVQINPFTDSSFINNTGLVGSWHLNEGTGTTAADMSGNGNNGTMNGSSYWNASGKFGSSFQGNGSSNYVNVPNATVLNPTSAVTVSYWVKNNGSVGMPVNKDSGSTGFYAYTNGSVMSLAVRTTSGSLEQYSVSNFGDNSWHLFTATWSNSDGYVRIYKDGVLDATSPTTLGGTIISNTNALKIGGTTSYYFGGQIDEFTLFNRALSASEIALRYGTAGVLKVRGDYADIRFADSTGATEYSYWQETDGKYWVKIPSLATGDTTINMYYGNASATSSSSGTNTFDFFDDYLGSSLDGAKWTGATGYATVANSIVTITGNGSWQKIYSIASFTPNVAVRTRAFFGSANEAVGLENTGCCNGRFIVYGAAGATAGLLTTNDIGTTQIAVGSPIISLNTFYTFDLLQLSGSSVKLYTNGTLTNTNTTVGTSTQTANMGVSDNGGTFKADWYLVRKYTATEPTHAAPGAETAP